MPLGIFSRLLFVVLCCWSFTANSSSSDCGAKFVKLLHTKYLTTEVVPKTEADREILFREVKVLEKMHKLARETKQSASMVYINHPEFQPDKLAADRRFLTETNWVEKNFDRDEYSGIESMTNFGSESNMAAIYENPELIRDFDDIITFLKEKTPNLEGVVYRGVGGVKNYKRSPSSKKIIDSLLTGKSGDEFTIPAFWPASETRTTALGFMDRSVETNTPEVYLIIKTKTAKRIQGFTSRVEDEVWVMPGTNLRVVGRQVVPLKDYNKYNPQWENREVVVVLVEEI